MNKKINDLRILHQAEIDEEKKNALLIGGSSANSNPCGIDLCFSDCGSNCGCNSSISLTGNCGCNSSISLTGNAGNDGDQKPIVDDPCYTNWNKCPNNNKDDDNNFGISL